MSYIRMDVWKKTQGFHLGSQNQLLKTPLTPPHHHPPRVFVDRHRSTETIPWFPGLMEGSQWGDWVKPWVSHSCGTWWFAGVPWKTQGLCNHYPIVCQHLGWGSLEWIFVRVRSSFWLFEAFKTEVASIFPRNQATHTQPWLWQMYNLFVERK